MLRKGSYDIDADVRDFDEGDAGFFDDEDGESFGGDLPLRR